MAQTVKVGSRVINLNDEQLQQCLDPKERGHITRFSDSSLYDEKCVLCGAVDGMPLLGIPDTLSTTDCEIGLSLRLSLSSPQSDESSKGIV